MFLNKKALRKIWVLTGAYLTVGVLSFISAISLAALGITVGVLIGCGVFCLIMVPLVYAIGRYAEGKGKLINANKLVTHELYPAEFIRLYEEKRDDPSNVITKPDAEVLQCLVLAYDLLGQSERALETLEYALSIAPDKKRNQLMLSKCGLLYSIRQCEEAEAIYQDTLNKDLNILDKSFADALMKTDRALAMGDDATAEIFFRQSLTKSFPKPTPLSLLTSHYCLAKICDRTQRTEEATTHWEYCMKHGGETNIQREAASRENCT